MREKLKNIVLSPVFIVLVFLGSVIVRYYSLPAMSLDMEAGLFKWYGFILKRGFANAFKENFALYTPPYLYLLWLGTLVDGIVSRVTLIKTISIGFDVVTAFYVYKITDLKYKNLRVSFLSAVLAFSLPTVVLNSSYWGQCDSIYTAFLLASVYYVMVNRPGWAVFSFSLAFAFKLQAVFLLPFLIVFALRKKISWLFYILVPVVYFISVLPTILVGRPMMDAFLIYAQQTDKFPKWSSTTPTMYLPLQGRIELTPVLSMLTVFLAGLIVLVWVYYAWKKRENDTSASILMTALSSVALVPFILPRMHQRYFYPQDILTLLLAIFFPKFWFLPVFSQIISLLAYSPFLFNITPRVQLFGRNLNAILYVALPLELLLLVISLWMQFRHSIAAERVSFGK